MLIDPAQPEPRWGWNPLDGEPNIAADQLCGVFSQVFGKFWGPRADDTLRTSCLTLTRHAHANLSMIPSLLSNKKIRGRITAGLDDPDGLGSYWAWYESLPVSLQAQVIGPVLSRLRAFLLRDFVNQTIGKPYSTLNFAQVLDRGGILLARLPKGLLGSDSCQLLGSLLVSRIWQTVTARSAVPESERRDCTLILDEAPNFLNLPRSLDEIAAEARGYHLNLVLAHQHNPQFSAETQAAISANARNKIYFGVSPEDARIWNNTPNRFSTSTTSPTPIRTRRPVVRWSKAARTLTRSRCTPILPVRRWATLRRSVAGSRNVPPRRPIALNACSPRTRPRPPAASACPEHWPAKRNPIQTPATAKSATSLTGSSTTRPTMTASQQSRRAGARTCCAAGGVGAPSGASALGTHRALYPTAQQQHPRGRRMPRSAVSGAMPQKTRRTISISLGLGGVYRYACS